MKRYCLKILLLFCLCLLSWPLLAEDVVNQPRLTWDSFVPKRKVSQYLLASYLEQSLLEENKLDNILLSQEIEKTATFFYQQDIERRKNIFDNPQLLTIDKLESSLQQLVDNLENDRYRLKGYRVLNFYQAEDISPSLLEILKQHDNQEDWPNLVALVNRPNIFLTKHTALQKLFNPLNSSIAQEMKRINNNFSWQLWRSQKQFDPRESELYKVIASEINFKDRQQLQLNREVWLSFLKLSMIYAAKPYLPENTIVESENTNNNWPEVSQLFFDKEGLFFNLYRQHLGQELRQLLTRLQTIKETLYKIGIFLPLGARSAQVYRFELLEAQQQFDENYRLLAPLNQRSFAEVENADSLEEMFKDVPSLLLLDLFATAEVKQLIINFNPQQQLQLLEKLKERQKRKKEIEDFLLYFFGLNDFYLLSEDILPALANYQEAVVEYIKEAVAPLLQRQQENLEFQQLAETLRTKQAGQNIK